MRGRLTRSRLLTAVLALAIAGGCAVRIVMFLQRRSLWMDESMLALNIALVPARALVPLPLFEQVAPPLFVWLLRACVAVGGVSEYTLRVVPLVAGCLLLPAVWLAGRRTVGPRAAMVATWGAAFAPGLLHYSVEVKPYIVDALCGVVLVGLAARLARRPGDRRARVALFAAGALALGLSTPVIFVLAAVVLALLLDREWWRTGRGVRRERVRWLLPMMATWGALFAVLYTVVYRAEPAHGYMAHFWSRALLGAQGSVPGALRHLREGMLAPFFVDASVPPYSYAVLLVVCIGAVCAVRRAAWLGVLLAGPLCFMLLASAARAYPFGGRVGLFAAPLSCLLLGAGVAELTRRVPRAPRPFATLALGALVLLRTGREGAWLAWHTDAGEMPREIVADVLTRARPGEPIYLYVRGVPNWLMYSTDWRAPDSAGVWQLIRAVTALGPNAGNTPSRGRPVVAEGDSLRMPFRSTVLLLGVPPGIENFELDTVRGKRPDPGWAENEARRIEREGASRVWVVFLHYRPSAADALVGALEADGVRVRYSHERPSALVHLVELPTGGRAAADAADGVPPQR